MKRKYYIILSWSIYGINGAVQYLYNKVNALKRLGFNVMLFTGNSGKVINSLSKIYISDLKVFSDFIIPELQYSPMMFSERKRNQVISKMFNIVIQPETEYIIEANSISTAEWGELISQKLFAPCFWFDLQESYSLTSSEIEFVRFKVSNNSIAGIAPESISLMLKQPNVDTVCFRAYCSNSVQDVEYSIPDYILNANVRIGIIGRLNKPFIIPTLNKLKGYMQSKKNLSFAIVLIGGAPKLEIQRINTIFKNIDNINTYITDYIYPIPRNLIKINDLFISTSGSAVASMREGVPTVVIDANSNIPVGVLDYTITNDMYGENEYSLDELLDDILFHDFCKTHQKLGLEHGFEKFDYMSEVMTQLDYICKSKLSYYDISKIVPNNKYYFIMSLFCRIIGAKGIDFLRKQFRFLMKG